VALEYRAEVDGLRALAVILVILFHSGFERFSGGFVGVDVFFVISGYLITTILLKDIKGNRFSFVGFYDRRARRILPALYAVVIATLLFSSLVLYPEDLLAAAKSALAVPVFSSNFFFWSERGYFGGAGELKPLLHTWSLAVEEQFYIVFPIVLLALSKFKPWILTAVLGCVCVLSLAGSIVVTPIHFDTAFFFPFTRAWELLVGAFCGIWLLRKVQFCDSLRSELLAVLGLAMVVGSCLTFNSSTPFPGKNALVPTLGTALFLLSSTQAKLTRGLFSWQPLVFVGLVSYSLYLWHQPIFALTRHMELFDGNELWLIGTSFLLAVGSYVLVEKPFRNKDRISGRYVVQLGLIGSLVIFMIGGSIVRFGGLPNRFDPKDHALLAQLASYKNYNQERFDEREFLRFRSTDKRRVVLVGDSHAKDFLNIVVESGLFERYEFSTRQVNSECGNLLLKDYSTIRAFIPPSRLGRCGLMGRFDGEKFGVIVRSSDEIWLVSSWKAWVVERLPESLNNLAARFEKPVKVVGVKNFGTLTSKLALQVPAEQRSGYSQAVLAESSTVADLLDSIMMEEEFYFPIMDSMCGGNREHCSIFTKDGLLMSADGSHLTAAGAKEGSRRISGVLVELKGRSRELKGRSRVPQ